MSDWHERARNAAHLLSKSNHLLFDFPLFLFFRVNFILLVFARLFRRVAWFAFVLGVRSWFLLGSKFIDGMHRLLSWCVLLLCDQHSYVHRCRFFRPPLWLLVMCSLPRWSLFFTIRSNILHRCFSRVNLVLLHFVVIVCFRSRFYVNSSAARFETACTPG